MIDLLVIGAGLTGLFAAYTAARAGLRVRVIAKGMGATHWHAGTIDVLGYMPNGDGPVVDWAQALSHLPAAHPYRILDAEAIGKALDEFQSLVAAAGLPYERAGANRNTAALPRPQPFARENRPNAQGKGESSATAGPAGQIAPTNDFEGRVSPPISGRNHLLVSPVGAARPVYLAPIAQRAGDLADERPLVVVGLEGMADFYPPLIAENLQKQGHRARSATVPLSLLSGRRDNSPLQLARLLDYQPAAQARLAEMVADAALGGERVGIPALLGLNNHTHLFAQLQEATAHLAADGGRASGSIFEIPTLPPSVPGMRLDAALRARLAALGVRIEMGMEACRVQIARRLIQWVETETSSRPLRHRARKYLLATGGILGGGICGDRCGRAQEIVFDLPLIAPQTRAQWVRPLFLDRRGHPIFQSGVPVDVRFRPLDESGAPVCDNLWAAGAILAHTDPIRERSREGIAIATGYAAARQIVDSG